MSALPDSSPGSLISTSLTLGSLTANPTGHVEPTLRNGWVLVVEGLISKSPRLQVFVPVNAFDAATRGCMLIAGVAFLIDKFSWYNTRARFAYVGLDTSSSCFKHSGSSCAHALSHV